MKRSEKYKMFIQLTKNEAVSNVNCFIPYNLIWKKDKDTHSYKVIVFITDIAPPMSFQDCGLPKDVFFCINGAIRGSIKTGFKSCTRFS